MKLAFNLRTGLVGLVGAILGSAAGLGVLVWSAPDGRALESELARRDRALATFISAVKAADATTRDDALASALGAAMTGPGAAEFPLVYAAWLSSAGRLQQGWVNRRRVQRIFPAREATSSDDASKLLRRLLERKIARKGRVKEYSVQLPKLQGTVKLGFDVTGKGADDSSVWIKASVVFAVALLLAFGTSVFVGGPVGYAAVEQATVALKQVIDGAGKETVLQRPGATSRRSSALRAGMERTIMHGAAELERWRKRFYDVAPHVPRSVRDALLLDRELGTDERAVTALRVEFRGLQERMIKRSARECLELANHYLDLAVETLRAHDAVVGQIEPDGVWAWWGAPEAVHDAEGKAVLAALQLREKALDETRRRKAAGDDGLSVCAAIATGRAVAGRIGSSGRMQYTIVGAPVFAAHALARQAGESEVLVCAVTLDLLGKERFRVAQHHAAGPDGKPAHRLVALAGSTMEYRPG